MFAEKSQQRKVGKIQGLRQLVFFLRIIGEHVVKKITGSEAENKVKVRVKKLNVFFKLLSLAEFKNFEFCFKIFSGST